MAYTRFGFAGQIIPFWKRQIVPLPKWQKGDPQIRLFLPTFWMKMIKPPEGTPKNQVYFVTHPQMTRMDIKNYLEKIYDVPVDNVRTQVKLTSNEPVGLASSEAIMWKNRVPEDPVRDKMRQSTKWSEEYKQAIVVLAKGQTFDFPDIGKSQKENQDAIEEFTEKRKEPLTDKAQVSGVPHWFL